LFFLVFLVALSSNGAQADVIDETSKLQSLLDQTNLEILAHHRINETWKTVEEERRHFVGILTDPEAIEIWKGELDDPGFNLLAAARLVGGMAGELPHSAALEMLTAVRRGDVASAREWRATIAMPKRANSVNGSRALQEIPENPEAQQRITKLLAREYLAWQVARLRQKLANLSQLARDQRADPALCVARSSEVLALAQFPKGILEVATGNDAVDPRIERQRVETYRGVQMHLGDTSGIQLQKLGQFREAIEAGLPNVLETEDIARKEALIFQLRTSLSKEYHEGVRDGKVAIPIEYQKARGMLSDIRQAMDDLLPAWQTQPRFDSRRLIAMSDELQEGFDRKVDSKVFDRSLQQFVQVVRIQQIASPEFARP